MEASGEQTWLNVLVCSMRSEEGLQGMGQGFIFSISVLNANSRPACSKIVLNNHIKSNSVQGLLSVVVMGISFQSVLEENALNLCYWNELSCAQPCLSSSNYVSKSLNPCKEHLLTREKQNFDWKKPLAEAWGLICVDAEWESSVDLCCNENKRHGNQNTKQNKTKT